MLQSPSKVYDLMDIELKESVHVSDDRSRLAKTSRADYGHNL